MKFVLYVDTGFVGALHKKEIEIDDEEYNNMTDEELNTYLEEAAIEFMHDRIDYGWER